MKKSMSLILIIALLCSIMMAQTAIAAEMPAVTVPVQISLSGTVPDPAEKFVVELVAVDEECPMPKETKGRIYTMEVIGAGNFGLPTITYENPGIYKYTIRQLAGTNPKCTYDDTVYEMTVYVTNAEDGSGLEATAILYPDSDGTKQIEAKFHNEYETETEPETEVPETEQPITEPPSHNPKTGDESNLSLYMILIGISGAVIVFLLAKNKRKISKE
ncbi:MAG: FctA domain-containing protein [Lachnospiraceae bacterium]|nr:sortase B protein-sorting domain-containing protein [Robinsoniella sp.]MDY3765468.1 FctA domain-containing protein [Lachnospiraceae bacterium]